MASGLLFAGARAEFPSSWSKLAAVVAFLLALLSLVYLVMAARHSLRALGRSTYFALGPEDLLDPTVGDAATMRRRIAIEYATHAFRNRAPTNRKVDAVHLAHGAVSADARSLFHAWSRYRAVTTPCVPDRPIASQSVAYRVAP